MCIVKFILSCVLMALVSVHNTLVWIQTWKENVVFLQQICTDLQHLHKLLIGYLQESTRVWDHGWKQLFCMSHYSTS